MSKTIVSIENGKDQKVPILNFSELDSVIADMKSQYSASITRLLRQLDQSAKNYAALSDVLTCAYSDIDFLLDQDPTLADKLQEARYERMIKEFLGEKNDASGEN